MRTIWLFLIWLLGLTLSVNAIETKTLKKDIQSVQGNEVTFEAGNLKVGESGVIVTKSKEYEIIIAKADIINIQDKNATAKFSAFEAISQKYLPTPSAMPKVGDNVIFRSFYNRAIAIAPNQESYQHIVRSNPQVQFMHIDLFAAFMKQKNLNDPNPKVFREFCPCYSIGLLFIMDSTSIKVLDCQSFVLLENQSLPAQNDINQTTSPFFSRITSSDKRLGGRFKSNKSKEYFVFYDELLKEAK